MSTSRVYRWERISDETRHQRDPALAIPTEVVALLTEGLLAPHRNVRQAPGVYYYFGHLRAATAAEKRNPKTELRAWETAASRCDPKAACACSRATATA